MDNNILSSFTFILISMNNNISDKDFIKVMIVLISVVGIIMFFIHMVGNRNEANPVKTSIIETFGLDNSSSFMEKYGD